MRDEDGAGLAAGRVALPTFYRAGKKMIFWWAVPILRGYKATIFYVYQILAIRVHVGLVKVFFVRRKPQK